VALFLLHTADWPTPVRRSPGPPCLRSRGRTWRSWHRRDATRSRPNSTAGRGS